MRSLVGCILWLSGALLPAAPITYAEPPDLPGAGGQTFVLDIGQNTISGFVNGTPFGGDYQDNFSVTLPANLQLSSGWLSITNMNAAGGLGCFTGQGCTSTSGFFGLTLTPGSTVSLTATSPYSDAIGGGVNVGSFNWIVTYNVTASTQPVPEPPAAVLGLLGLLPLLLRRRR